MTLSLVSCLLLLLARQTQQVTAIPFESRAITHDAPYTVQQTAIEQVVACPNSTGQAGGIILLVHGTGSTGKESWASGPYLELLPSLSPGYDVCYVTLPNRSQTDIQVTSEYVAGNIAQLAQKSKTGKISLIGHSQGNLNIQWSLNFWPSTRQYVEHFISISGDLHGTDEGPTLCAVSGLANGAGNCTQASIQQSTTRLINGKSSMFLTALERFGNTALVPTTSIYTLYDDIIQSEQGKNATSILPGAQNIVLQDPNICGKNHIADHFTMLIDAGVFALAYGTLQGTSVSTFNKVYCDTYIGKNRLSTAQLTAMTLVPGDVSSVVNALKSGNQFANARMEPPLMPYVCASGSAPAQQCQ